MAENREAAPQGGLRVEQGAKLDSANVHLTPDNRLQVEFRISDLIKRLLPDAAGGGSCGGCNGCTGCSM